MNWEVGETVKLKGGLDEEGIMVPAKAGEKGKIVEIGGFLFDDSLMVDFFDCEIIVECDPEWVEKD